MFCCHIYLPIRRFWDCFWRENPILKLNYTRLIYSFGVISEDKTSSWQAA